MLRCRSKPSILFDTPLPSTVAVAIAVAIAISIAVAIAGKGNAIVIGPTGCVYFLCFVGLAPALTVSAITRCIWSIPSDSGATACHATSPSSVVDAIE